MDPITIGLVFAANLAFTAWRDNRIKHEEARERLARQQQRRIEQFQHDA